MFICFLLAFYKTWKVEHTRISKWICCLDLSHSLLPSSQNSVLMSPAVSFWLLATHCRAGKEVERYQPHSAFLLPVPVQKNVKGQLFQILSLRPAVEGQNQDRLLRVAPEGSSSYLQHPEWWEGGIGRGMRRNPVCCSDNHICQGQESSCGTGENKSKALTCLQTTSVRTDPKEVSTRLRIPVLLSSEPEVPCASENEGHPVPEPYFFSELGKTLPTLRLLRLLWTHKGHYMPQLIFLPSIIWFPVSSARSQGQSCDNQLHGNFAHHTFTIKDIFPLQWKGFFSLRPMLQ